jgi:hypothetical protein
VVVSARRREGRPGRQVDAGRQSRTVRNGKHLSQAAAICRENRSGRHALVNMSVVAVHWHAARRERDDVMEYFKRPIPKGYQIYATFDVAGVHLADRRASLIDFLSGRNLDVFLEPEPTNAHDKNAVLVVGLYERKGLIQSLIGGGRRQRVVLGYVPAREAEALQVAGALRQSFLG